jgi:hypothetical protein
VAAEEPHYAVEYVSTLLILDQTTDTTFSFVNANVVNRGRAVEWFRVIMNARYTDEHGTVSAYSYSFNPSSVEPGGIGGDGLVEEADSGVHNYESMWVRVLATSRNVVPSINYGLEHATGPEFNSGSGYISPGEFAVFDILNEIPLPIPPVGLAADR